jgi:hypothetical protein
MLRIEDHEHRSPLDLICQAADRPEDDQHSGRTGLDAPIAQDMRSYTAMDAGSYVDSR